MIASILPPNATSLELHVEQSATATLETMPLDIAKLWNPDTCPAHILPWLAWALDVEQWRSDAPIATQRAAIKGSITVHDTMGTPAAMQHALENLGYAPVQIFEYSAQWHAGRTLYNGLQTHAGATLLFRFDVHLNAHGTRPTAPELLRIKAAIHIFKNARSHLRNLFYASLWHDGAYTHNGAIMRDGGLILG